MSPTASNIVATRLRVLRAQHPDVTQDALADEVGVSQNAIGRWERGQSTPRAHQIARICDVYSRASKRHISADYVIGRCDFEGGLTPGFFLADLDSIARRKHDDAYRVKIPARYRVVDDDGFKALVEESSRHDGDEGADDGSG